LAQIENLPIAPTAIRDGVLAELDHLTSLVEGLSPEDWSRPSAVRGWSVADVVAHLDVFIGMYGGFLSTVLAGRGSSTVARLIGLLIGSILPRVAPAFDAINGVIPKVVGGQLGPERVKRQFVVGAHRARQCVLRVCGDDYNRPVYFEGGPYPLSFYLGVVLNELAIHGWDVESAIDQQIQLGAQAREVLPWFYWSSSRLMLRLREGATGTLQVQLTDPDSTMWWSLSGISVGLGRTRSTYADAEIRGALAIDPRTLAGFQTLRSIARAEVCRRHAATAGSAPGGGNETSARECRHA
jgi:hypothetical protein